MHPDWVPAGRDRLGFEYWRAYNQHMVYFDGFVQKGDWDYARWKGYETDGLFEFGREFLEEEDERPFALFLSPHQPHYKPGGAFAPEHYYDRLPATVTLPPNVPPEMRGASLEMYRHYLAMILAIDDMLGRVLDHLEQSGRLDDTLVVFSSDHGTQAGSQGIDPWMKKMPYEGSIHVPMVMRLPGVVPAGARAAGLVSMVDVYPTLCTLLGVGVPRSFEGMELSTVVRGVPGPRRDDVYLMNFSAAYDWLKTGMEWRGLRSATTTYVRWLDGRTELYDLAADPHQTRNLAGSAEIADLEHGLATRLDARMRRYGDALRPIDDLHDWFDEQRRVVRNAYGPLSHPESSPDWSLMF